ncbi:MAG: hypothetical protein ACRCYS_01585, partial [Beijerinckiaceae bacterium]
SEKKSVRELFAKEAAVSDAIELELAATAIFLAKSGSPDPWGETAQRKPEKAVDGRIDKAKSLYEKLAQIQTPTRLPNLHI